MKKFLRKKIVLPIAVAVVLFVTFGMVIHAFWNPAEVPGTAVRINPAEIENSTLIIGTHLIYLGALSQHIYDIAAASVAVSGQDRIFYKSELLGGAWCDITEATSLAAIADGVPGQQLVVEDAVIQGLWFTHHTRPDGITYDLRTNEPVNIFNIRPLYELMEKEELRPLRMHYDLIVETQLDSAQGAAAAARADIFWQTNVQNAATRRNDGIIDALQRYYEIVVEEYDASWLRAIKNVMEAADASRRAAVFRILEITLLAYLDDATSMEDIPARNDYDDEGNIVATLPAMTAFPIDAGLVAAIGESLSNVQAALIEQESLMLSPGVTAATAVRYDLSNDLINAALGGNHAAADIAVERLVHLENILQNQIADRSGEYDLLDRRLIPPAQQRYLAMLGEGESPRYRAAVANQSAMAVLRAIAREDEGTLSGLRMELEFFIDAFVNRINTSEAVDYLEGRIHLTRGWFARVPGDAYYEQTAADITAHIEFLSRLQSQLNARLGPGELDALIAEKAALQALYMEALDNLHLALALAIAEQIAEIDARIELLENEINADISALLSELDRLQDIANSFRADPDPALRDTISGLEDELNALFGQLDRLYRVPVGEMLLGEVLGRFDEAADTLNNFINGSQALRGDLETLHGAGINEVLGLRTQISGMEFDLLAIAARLGALQGFLDEITDYPGLTDEQSSAAALLQSDLDNLGSGITGLVDGLADLRNRGGVATDIEEILSLTAGMASLESDADSVEWQLNNLLSQLAGIDNPRALENRINNQINDIQDSLANANAQLTAPIRDVLDRIREIEADITVLNSALPENSIANIVATLRGESLSIIAADGNLQTLDDNINALAALLDMNPTLVFPALNDIYDAMLRARLRDNTPRYNDAIAALEDIILANEGAFAAAIAGRARADDLLGLIDAHIAGGGFDAIGAGMTEAAANDLRETAIIIALLDFALSTGNDNAARLAAVRASNAHIRNNPFIYTAITNISVGEYIPVTAIARYTRMRYVWNRNLNQATLTRGIHYYSFSAFSDRVVRGAGAGEYTVMPRAARLQTQVHIPVEFAADAFNVSGRNVPHTNLGVMVSAAVQSEINELLQILERGFV